MKLAARALLVGVTASFVGMVFAQSANAQMVNVKLGSSMRLGTTNDMMLWEPEGTYTKVTTGSVLVPAAKVIEQPVTIQNQCIEAPVVLETDKCLTPAPTTIIEQPAVIERTAPVLIQEHRRPLIDIDLF